MLTDLGFEFEVFTKEIPEDFPDEMPVEEVAEYLAKQKARAYSEYADKKLIITADTIVCLGRKVLGKPGDRPEAIRMISELSGKSHQVISGVCLFYQGNIFSFSETTQVFFRNLKPEEIEYYVDNYKPFDKAGAYGIQEWIGMIGIEKIVGDYYNVMGLPLCRLNTELQKFLKRQ